MRDAALGGAADGDGAYLFHDECSGEYDEWEDEWDVRWDHDDLFVDMCILAGTDYWPGLWDVGLKTARDMLLEYGPFDGYRTVSQQREPRCVGHGVWLDGEWLQGVACLFSATA